MARIPRGYVGTAHETRGADILAVLKTVSFPEQIFEAKQLEQLRAVDPDRWYPIRFFLDAMDVIEKKVGPMGLRQIGRQLFKVFNADHLRASPPPPAMLIRGLDAMYRRANRGSDIGGWEVVSFEPGIATLRKNTPHPCMMEEGILSEALATLGVPATVKQSGCVRDDADVCTFVISAPGLAPA